MSLQRWRRHSPRRTSSATPRTAPARATATRTKPNDRVVTVGTKAEVAEAQRKNQLIDRQVKAAKDGLAAFADPLREQYLDELKQQKGPAKKVSDDDLAKRFPEYAA